MADMTLGVLITADASELEQESKKAESAVQGVADEAESSSGKTQSAMEAQGSAAESFAGRLKDAMASGISSVGSFASAVGQAMQEAGQAIHDAGGKIQNAGKEMSVGITAPLVGVYKASEKAFNEVDAGMDAVATKTGATGDELEALQDIMKNVATSIPTDFGTAGDAVGEVNTRFGLTGDALEELSGKFVKFGQLNETDVPNAVDKTQQILSTFGLTADDAGAMLDTFNDVSQRTGVGVDELMASTQANATAFKELGFGAADTINFLGQLDVSGADSQAVLAGLKKSMQNAAKEGKPMSSAMEEVQNSIKNAETSTEATQIAMELFGAKAGPAIAQAVREGKLSFDDLGNSLSDAEGNIETTFENTQDAGDRWKTMMNTLSVPLADLGETIQSNLTPYIELAATKISELTTWFNNLSPGMQDLIIKIALIAAAIGPALVIVGSVVGAIGTIVSAIGTVISVIGTVLSVVGTVVAAVSAPVLIIVGLIAALVAVFIYLWNTNENFRAAVIGIWEAIVSFFTGVIETIKGIFNAVKDFLFGIWENIKGDAQAAWELLKVIILGPVLLLCDLVTGDFDKLKEDAAKIWEKIKENGGKLWEDFKNFVVETATSLYEGVQEKISEIPGIVEEGFNTAIDFITSLPGQAVQWGEDIVSGIADGIRNGFAWVQDAASSIADTIRGFLHFSEPDVGPLSDFHTYMPDMMKGLADGMRKNLPTLRAGVELVAGEMTGIVPGTGAAYAYAGGGSVSNLGGVTIQVYGAEGQDEETIADRVMAKIMELVELEG